MHLMQSHRWKLYTPTLSKAFDILDHAVLFSKLSKFSFSNNLIAFYKSYLNNLSQHVEFCSHQSYEFIPPSWVPQGSVLGPPFLNIFINDIVTELNVNYLLYADDMKIYKRLDYLNGGLVLQCSLDNNLSP